MRYRTNSDNVFPEGSAVLAKTAPAVSLSYKNIISESITAGGLMMIAENNFLLRAGTPAIDIDLSTFQF